jgi:hypothetical protein
MSENHVKQAQSIINAVEQKGTVAQQQQLQGLTHLLVSAITQQQQVQYATQLQQLLRTVATVKNEGASGNSSSDEGCSVENNGQNGQTGQNGKIGQNGQNAQNAQFNSRPQFNRRAYANVPVEQLQAAQLAAAAVTAKHKQVSQNSGNNNALNACTVQCIDPVTRRTVLYRPGGTGKQNKNQVNTYNPTNYLGQPGQNGQNYQQNPQNVQNTYQNGQNNQWRQSNNQVNQNNVQNYQNYQNGQFQQNNFQNNVQNTQNAQNAQTTQNHFQNNIQSNFQSHQQTGSISPIGSNRPRKNLTNDYFSDSCSSRDAGRSSPSSGSSSPGPNNQHAGFFNSQFACYTSSSSSGAASDSENSIDYQKGVSCDDDDVLSELNRQINLICFS